jgi:prevent-host-death family protein
MAIDNREYDQRTKDLAEGKPNMATVTIQEAQATLSDLIHRLTPGEEVVITENDRPIARLVPTPAAPQRKLRQLGTMKGTVLYMAPDFDAPLEDFKEYME